MVRNRIQGCSNDEKDAVVSGECHPRTISSMYIPHPKHRSLCSSFARCCSSRVPSLSSHAMHLLADSKPSRQPSHPPSSFTPPRTPPITAAGTEGRPELPSWTSDVGRRTPICLARLAGSAVATGLRNVPAEDATTSCLLLGSRAVPAAPRPSPLFGKEPRCRRSIVLRAGMEEESRECICHSVCVRTV